MWARLFVALIFFSSNGVLSVLALSSMNVDALISKANIYYQRPLALGPPMELPLEKVKELGSNRTTNIKVIVHGFISSRWHVSIRPLGNAYMAEDNADVFLADWSDAAGLDYHSSRKAVEKVAQHFGVLLEEFFRRLNISHSDVHVLGHSLGAHIAGGIGKYFNGSLARVTGLDPALPLFTPHAEDGLQAKAARFVDVIHTDFPVFGDITPRGTIDFYPNFGRTPQKGCEDIDFLTASKLIFEAYSCSHNRAVILYAESIRLPESFLAWPCNYATIKLRNVEACTTQINREMDVIPMGEYVPRSKYGTFYLETFETSPFGMGKYSNIFA